MKRFLTLAALFLLFCFPTQQVFGQALGNAGTIQGTVVDQSGAAVPNAQVTLRNVVSGYMQTAQSGTDGMFRLVNIPPAPYRLEVSASGFATLSQDVEIRNAIPIQLKATLAVAGAQTTVNVESALEAIENKLRIRAVQSYD
jgi:hypothetical protein